MGKKKGKKVDLDKKLVLQAKKDAKRDKAARKRLSKQQQHQSDGDDGSTTSDLDVIDQVLQAYKDQQEKLVQSVDKPTLENLSTEFPLPRANATLEHGADDKNRDFLYLFGGEYFDGIENVVLDELLRFDCRKREWKQIWTVPPRPSPRCAHSCVAYKSSLFVFGGEMATADAYHHYRDMWKFDLNTLQWIEITAKNPPSARSGHSCIVWKNFMILIGGFFEALRETKWYNDVHVFNLQTETWMDVPQSRLSMKPEPRSACNVALYGVDKAIIHGGFSKFKSPNASAAAETKVHTDAWILHLAPILQQKAPTWERWMSSTKTLLSSNSPNGRAGTSCLSYKNRMLVFGGVVDQEQHHHKVDSIFYNDLMAMDIDRRKWFPLRIKDKSGGGHGGKRQQQDDKDTDKDAATAGGDADAEEEKVQDEEDSASDLEDENGEGIESGKENTGWNLDMLRSNMFAFIDGDGNIVYEKIDVDGKKEEESELGEVKEEEEDEEECKAEEKEEEQENEEEKEEGKEETKDHRGSNSEAKYPSQGPTKVTSSSVMILNEGTNTTEPVARSDPLPRINGAIVLHGHTMYMLGGILEVGDREITLDDMWALDLRKRDKWECLWPGTMHKQVWRGAIHDDEDSYISTGRDDNSSEEDDDDNEDDLLDEDEEVTATKKTSKHNRAGLREEVAELNGRYGLEDENRTPNPGEVLADFYSRTSDYWNSQVAKELAGIDSALSNKELKRQGFALAKERFEELEPVLSRLAELGIGGAEDKQTDRKSSSDKKVEKKKKSKR